LAPNFFGEGFPNWDLHYKAHADADHAATFHGDHHREVGDLVVMVKRINKTSAVKQVLPEQGDITI